MDRYADQEQPSEMSNQEFTNSMMSGDDPKDALFFWPRPNNLLSLLAMVYGNDVEKITTWLDDPNTEVDEYLTTWDLTPQITRLDMFRRAATRTGTTFARLCTETRALALSGGVPAQAQRFASAPEKVPAKTTDGSACDERRVQ